MKINKKKIDLLLAERMLTIAELADLIGVSRQMIYYVEKKSSVQPKTAGKIAAALGVPVLDIIEMEE